jgi:glutathione S-transferase
MITIHHSRNARSVRAIWLLEELGVQYVLAPVEFKPAAMKSAEYLALHPLGQIPAIEDGAICMFESGAIVEYLLERYGDGKLAPTIADPEERAQYLKWFHYGEASLAKWMNDIVRARYYLPETERVPEVLPLSRRHYREALAVVDRALSDRPFICGAEFSAADIMVSYGVTIGKFIGELPAELERLAAYLGRLKERPAYLRAWGA